MASSPVLGLDNRPQARLISHASPAMTRMPGPHNLPAPSRRSKLPNSMIPAGADGNGQCIAIIELAVASGRATFSAISKHFENQSSKSGRHLRRRRHNKPPVIQRPDGEVMLDIEVAGAVAPKSTLAVYFAPNTDRASTMPSPPPSTTRAITLGHLISWAARIIVDPAVLTEFNTSSRTPPRSRYRLRGLRRQRLD